VKELVKENIAEQSNLVQLIIGEMTEKNMAFIDYIQQNQYYIIFMKDIINNFIEFDSKMLSPSKNALKKNSSKNKVGFKFDNIINKLVEHGDKSLSGYADNQKILINSFFTKMLIDELFEKNNPLITYEKNQILFLFLLDNSILNKLIDLFGYFINIDYTLVQLYSIIRKKNISDELNDKYIHFIQKYIDIENFGNYIVRSLKNKKTFDNLFKCKNINIKYIFVLFNVIENVINNLANNINDNNYSSQGGNIIYIFNEILEHISIFFSINFNFANTELYLYGKIVRTLIKNLNKKNTNLQNNKNATPNNEQENNNSNVINQINTIIEQLYSLILPKFICIYYKYVISIFNEKDKKLYIDYSLDNIYLTFYLILDIISSSKDENNYYNILSEKVEPDIINFFSNLLEFNKYNDYLINVNFYNYFKDKYIALSNDTIAKKLLDNMFLFMLFKGKLDEKNLKSVIIQIYDEFKDNEKGDDFKKIEYLIFYFLSSIKKDNSNANKNNNNTSMNYGDFSLISSIGERFKEDEKSLQKKNPVQPALNK
jgi:hypothetical protein